MSEFVTEIKSVEDFDNLTDERVVLKFWADWCGPCKRFAPHFDKVAESDSGYVTFASVDVDAVPELAQRYDVLGIPTVLALDGDAVVGYVQSRTALTLAREIDDLYTKE